MKGAIALALMLAFGAAAPAHAAEGQIAVVAAENFYGDIARQIGGDRVAVVSIMNNPDQDPHLFETTPSIVRQLAAAQIVIINGANYDPWMDKLLAATPRTGRMVISAAQLTGRKPGDNPHLWYDPVTMPAVATALAEALAKADSAHAGLYRSPQDDPCRARTHHTARCAAEGQTRRDCCDRDRAGIQPDGRSARAHHAQPAFPACHDERY